MARRNGNPKEVRNRGRKGQGTGRASDIRRQWPEHVFKPIGPRAKRRKEISNKEIVAGLNRSLTEMSVLNDEE